MGLCPFYKKHEKLGNFGYCELRKSSICPTRTCKKEYKRCMTYKILGQDAETEKEKI